ISSHAEPIIREIIKYKLRTYGGRSSADAIDAEDVYGETLVQILEELRSVRSNHERSICNFRSYVATVTYHCCYEYLRERRPQRYRLKDRIRYLLSHHKSFALWSGEKDDWICGFALWKDSEKRTVPMNLLQQLFNASNYGSRVSEGENLALLVSEIFNRAREPIALYDLVKTVADLLGLKEGVDS